MTQQNEKPSDSPRQAVTPLGPARELIAAGVKLVRESGLLSDTAQYDSDFSRDQSEDRVADLVSEIFNLSRRSNESAASRQ